MMKNIGPILLGAITLIVAASSFLLFLALPVVDAGFFAQVEPVATGQHVLTAILAMVILLYTVVDPAGVRESITRPVAALGLIALVGALVLPFAEDPGRSFYGTFEHMVGVIWHVELFVLCIGAVLVWRLSGWGRVAIAVSPAAVVAFSMVLEVVRIRVGAGILVPYQFPEWYGLGAALAAVPLLALRVRWALVFAGLIVAGGVWISENKSVVIVLSVFAVTLAVIHFFRLRGEVLRRSIGICAAFTAVAVLVLLMGLKGPLERILLTNIVDDGVVSWSAQIPSSLPIDHISIHSKAYGTLWNRSVSAQLGVSKLLKEPGVLALGMGYGSFQELVTVGKRMVPGRSMHPRPQTASMTYWDFQNKASFHTHNLLLETVLSIGILGGALWLWFLWVVGSTMDPRRLAAGLLLLSVLVIGGSFWFLMNSFAPFLAVAVACVGAGALPRRVPAKAGLADVGTTIAFSLFALMLSGVAAVRLTVLEGLEREFRYPILFSMPGMGVSCIGYEAVTVSNREINRHLVTLYLNRLQRMGPDERSQNFNERKVNVANFSCVLRQYAAAGDVLSLEASLEMRNRLLALLSDDRNELLGVLAPDFSNWNNDIRAMLSVAPTRTDLLIPFIEWLDPQQRPQDVIAEIDAFMPVLHERDPVRHWLLAQRAAAERDSPVYLAEMRQALRLGLGNIVTVPASSVESLGLRGAAR